MTKKDDDFAFTLTGPSWIAKDVAGATDYEAFARAAMERGVVLGPASDAIPAGWKRERK